MLIRKRKKRHARRNKHLRIALIVVAVVVALVGASAFGAWSLMKSGEKNLRQQATDIQTADNAVTYDEGKTIERNGHTYKLNENMVSICVIGYDRRQSDQTGHAGQADVIMVLALDTATGKTTAIGVPRDSMVEVGEYVGEAFLGMDTMQVCLAYSYGNNDVTSCEYTTAIVQRVLYNMPISYYYALDMSGVSVMADAIGGVALTPLQSIPDTSIEKDVPTVLFGDNALKYIMWRDHSNLNSSLDRQARQVQFLEAYASQALTAAKGDVGVLLDLFNTAAAYSTTNLGASEFSYLASCLVSNGITELEVVSLQGEMTQGEKYAEFILDKDAVYQTVLDVYYTQVD
ncbi:LCP family protein [Adlercreutzia sp. ZJ473]|uniref:LCP family protein n=1 Tax=Adlercreutzia sp. ZJ473 TaxID=2722822 RepID=UPI0015523867